MKPDLDKYLERLVGCEDYFGCHIDVEPRGVDDDSVGHEHYTMDYTRVITAICAVLREKREAKKPIGVSWGCLHSFRLQPRPGKDGLKYVECRQCAYTAPIEICNHEWQYITPNNEDLFCGKCGIHRNDLCEAPNDN